jgi:hypothetical protein
MKLEILSFFALLASVDAGVSYPAVSVSPSDDQEEEIVGRCCQLQSTDKAASWSFYFQQQESLHCNFIIIIIII